MDELERLPAATQGRLLRAIEAATSVHHRGELFLWFQGPVHALIPHTIVLCMALGGEQGVAHYDCLHAVPLEESVLAQLRDPFHGFVSRLAQHVRGNGRATFGIACERAPAETAALGQAAVRLGVAPGLVHFTGPVAEGPGTLFALLGLPEEPQPQHEALLGVLAPQLHLAFSRSRYFERTQGQPAPAGALDLSERQLEILHWVKLGKTNHEIALILSISDLTVKNHLQRLFRKLDVHNRAQAVARLMALGIE